MPVATGFWTMNKRSERFGPASTTLLVVPIQSGSPRMKDREKQAKSSRQSSELPNKELNTSSEAKTQSFQDQVLEELRKLKEAQRIEFEVFERLQREKDEVEHKARLLEQKLRKQQIQLLSKELNPTRTANGFPKTNAWEEIADEDNNAHPNVRDGNNSDELSSGEPIDGENIEVFDWEDVTESPPPYCTIASPAVRMLVPMTSPKTRILT
ncbi:unnamed protein product [Phytophthora fragariaefolia]|uniref:Unnamed protein product n=1 Tax=Phytophthora fragariaefolia TaxID=1490495 RepID=A0A9W6XP92_9STRA|nr:unnamed protein product [Phytophthora fragariaefolia]